MAKKKEVEAEVSRIDEIRAFANKHSDLFFIVSHPMTDEVLMAFNEQQSLFRFPSNADYFPNNVVFQVLNAETFHNSIDDYLTALQEGLKLKAVGNKVQEGAPFLGLVDGFLYNVSGAKELDAEKAEKKKSGDKPKAKRKK